MAADIKEIRLRLPAVRETSAVKETFKPTPEFKRFNGYEIKHHAILIGANLVGLHLRNADLVGANLSNANLSDADLTNANLFYANLSGTIAIKQSSAEMSITTGTTTPTKTTITCVKGKITKRVTGVNPKCPSGYKKK